MVIMQFDKRFETGQVVCPYATRKCNPDCLAYEGRCGILLHEYETRELLKKILIAVSGNDKPI
jgi:hypothetical protein